MDKTVRIRELIKLLHKASVAYYRDDSPIMTDKQYDDLYDELESLEKETGYILVSSPTQHVQGEVIDKLRKVKHIKPMLSANKTKDLGEIKKFIGDKKVVQSCKLDGLTVVATYSNGILVQAVTRGNGEIGEDVTHTFKHCVNLPLQLSQPVDITFRGECIIPWKTFDSINEKLSKPYSNPRNLASGTLRQLDSNIARDRRLEYYVFDVVDGYVGNSLMDAYNYADELGMPVVGHCTVNNLEDDYNIFDPQNYRLPVDGLIYRYDDLKFGRSLGITEHHPLDMMALKWADDLYETTLTGIEWQTSRTGMINPVAVFAPVDLDGAITTRATLHNISYIEDLELGIGDVIEVYRANMVIPKVHNNLTRSNTWTFPNKCPACGGDVEIYNENGSKTLHCMNPYCKAKTLSKLIHAVSRNALNIDGLSEATLEKFMEQGWVQSIQNIYHLDNYKEEMAKMEGFGERSTSKLLDSINKSRTTTLDRFLYAQSIPLIGQSASKDIARACHYDIDEFRMRVDMESEQVFRELTGFGEEMCKSIARWWQKERYAFCDLSKEFIFEKPIDKNSDVDLSGMTFVVTGSLEKFANRDSLKAELEALGAKVSGSVSAKTSYLVNNDINSNSSKNKKAKQLNVPIIDEDQLLEIMGR